MDSFILGEDIPVLCHTATSFPDGIQSAFDHLHQVLPKTGRQEVFRDFTP